MEQEIVDYDRCPTCGQVQQAPVDGRWRWASSGKVFASLAEAGAHAVRLNKGPNAASHEFMAAVDGQGQARIASRRRPPE
jgi:hypothetical protein